ncbi:MAG: hypothetical protein K2Z81_21495, partial [Cyanobacteria bacterium]|nr:hypothetical protein [Cyanobacteriota bacterium]
MMEGKEITGNVELKVTENPQLASDQLVSDESEANEHTDDEIAVDLESNVTTLANSEEPTEEFDTTTDKGESLYEFV